MDIYTALHNDHEHVRQLLEKLVATTELNDDTSELLGRIGDLLIPHSRAEEELFYNSIRRLEPDNDFIMHGFREHMEAETLLRTLQGMAMIGVEWTSAAKKLRDAVNHHIEEEETTFFSAGRRLFDEEEAQQIGRAFLALESEVKREGAIANVTHLVSNLMPPRLREQQSDEQEQPRRRRSA